MNQHRVFILLLTLLEVKPKQHDNCESDQEEIMLSAKELLSKTTHLRDPSFGINQSIQAFHSNIEPNESI